jgi:chromosome segregation ATPase
MGITEVLLTIVSSLLLLGVLALGLALSKATKHIEKTVQASDAATAAVAEAQKRLAQITGSHQKLQDAFQSLKVEYEALGKTSAAQLQKARADYEKLKAKALARLRAMAIELEEFRTKNASLAKWQSVVDAETKANELLRRAQESNEQLKLAARAELAAARREVAAIQSEGRRQTAEFESEAQRRLKELEGKLEARESAARLGLEEELQRVKAEVVSARQQAVVILARAQESARETAGEALDAKQNLDRLQRLTAAMENQISGYGTRYLVPIRSVVDELGAEMAHTDAGNGLKAARAATRALVEAGAAATCDYREEARRDNALQFVLEAFNGKVEAIIARVRAENAGTLLQQVRDAYEIVNHLGGAFKNARIEPQYLEARLDEVRWAALAQQAKVQQKEEQRRLKEKLRQDAKAQRELDKELKEKQREVKEAEQKDAELAAMRKRIESEQAQAVALERQRQEARLADELNRASESQRAELEARFHEEARLREEQSKRNFDLKLAEADRKQAELASELERLRASCERTKSMAEQTKSGTVYVISNIGSFGERVFKVGQTRRPNWMDRIWELGDASVPFDFDVHAHIATDDAPKLEGEIHAKLVEYQVNKMNWRKEFFRVDLGTIRKVIEEFGIAAEWTMAAVAEDYRNTLALEARMAADPAERERWIQEQLGIEFESAAESSAEAEDEDEDEVVA